MCRCISRRDRCVAGPSRAPCSACSSSRRPARGATTPSPPRRRRVRRPRRWCHPSSSPVRRGGSAPSNATATRSTQRATSPRWCRSPTTSSRRYDGVNTATGSYDVDGDELTVGPVARTEIAAAGRQLPQYELFELLERGSARRPTGDPDGLRLELDDATVLVFEPQRRRRPRLISVADGRASGRCVAPQRPVARPLESVDDVPGSFQLRLQAGQLRERHADVDVVRQVPAGVERHDPEPGDGGLADVVGRHAAVRARPRDPRAPRRHAAGSSPATPSSTAAARTPGRSTSARGRPRARRTARPARRGSPAPPVAAPDERSASSRPFRFFQPELPNASRRSLRRHDSMVIGVARVQPQVRLVRPELLAVVRHVAAPVDVEGDERRVGDEPPADPVVDPAVREQQSVCGLVAQDREAPHAPGPSAGTRCTQPTGWPHHAATASTPTDWTQSPATWNALATSGIRYSSSRSSPIGRPVGPSRSVGRTSVSSAGSGSIVLAARVELDMHRHYNTPTDVRKL